jgi:hypothetical protein
MSSMEMTAQCWVRKIFLLNAYRPRTTHQCPPVQFVRAATGTSVSFVRCWPLVLDPNAPLMAASGCGQDAVVELLLEAGAVANLPNEDGMTALIMWNYPPVTPCGR